MKKINRWIQNKRHKEKTSKQKKKIAHIDLKSKIILKNFFNDNSEKPCKNDIKELMKLTSFEEKKISLWFASRRFKTKKNNSNRL